MGAIGIALLVLMFVPPTLIFIADQSVKKSNSSMEHNYQKNNYYTDENGNKYINHENNYRN